MEVTFAWFILAKAGLAVLLAGLAHFTYNRGFKKVAYGLGLLVAIWIVFAPVKYNGANSDTYSKQNEQQVVSKYAEVDTEVKVFKKPTFKERMAEEEARALKANDKITEGL
jgi:hypothetical protein